MILTGFPFLLASVLCLQETTTGRTIVTATRVSSPASEAPYTTDVVDFEELFEQSYRTLPQMLKNTTGVLVQETSHGQGSPFIRGFTGFRNVLLIDGVRLNNSVFRDGPNQYWNTVDPYSIDRLEVVKGPSSVLYGSDAIGGTVQVLTKSSTLHGEGLHGSSLYRVSSAEHSHVGRLELDVSRGARSGFLFGGTGKVFGDVEGGHDTGDQPRTGYDEWDADLKYERLIGDDARLVFLHQSVRQNDVPRTHSTIHAVPFEGSSVGSDRRRELDQERDLTYLQLHAESSSVGVSYHDQGEERDRIRGSGTREFQGFDVGTLGAFGQTRHETGLGALTFGFDVYHDDVDSFSSTNPIQGPVADDATYLTAGVFVQDEIDLSAETTLILGTRFNYAEADARSVQDPNGPGTISIEDDWTKLVGSARVLHRTTATVSVFGGVSQGFRAPNLSDLTRFDSARTNEFEIPAPGLDPENFLAYELGIRRADEVSAAEAAVFYTDIEDAIVRIPTGNTNGAGEFEVTKDNAGDGYAFGVELSGQRRFSEDWLAFGDFTYMDGKAETFPTSAPTREEEYLDRLMPTTVHIGVRWEPPASTTWGEVSLLVVDDADRLSTRDAGDTSRIPPGGTPGYELLGVRGGMDLNPNVRMMLAVENLFDEDYRVHGSGTNGPGRGVILSLSLHH